MSSLNIIKNKTSQYWIIGSICFASFLALLDNYIVNISLPAISRYFNVSTSEVAYVTLIYLLVLTSSLIIFGKIVDNVGPKKIFVGGFAIFTLGSLFCGLSPSMNILLLSRVIQGIGASMLYASSFTIIPMYLPASIRGFSFGIISTSAAFGIMLGAPLGGIITGLFNWHWIFMINVPVGILAVIVSMYVIPDRVQKERIETHFDITGAIMIFICLLLLIFGLSTAQQSAFTTLPVLLSLAGSFLTFVAFIFWEKQNPDALVDFSLFKDLNFTYSNLLGFLGMAVFAGANFLLPFYLVIVKGFSEEKAGMLILIYSVVYLVVGPAMGKLSDKIKPHILCGTGMIVGVISCLVFAFTLNVSSVWPAVLFLVLQAIAYGLFISPNNNLLMTVCPEDKLGISSSIFKTVTNLSLIMGVIFFNTVFTLFIPDSILMKSQSLAASGISYLVLTNGFSDAFFAGAVMSLLAAVICFLIKDYQRSAEPVTQLDLL